jgi:hypothetical protein
MQTTATKVIPAALRQMALPAVDLSLAIMVGADRRIRQKDDKIVM